MRQIDRREGRRLFGADPAAYERARPGHPDRVYEVLVEKCGVRVGAAVLEIGPGTGQATRRLLEFVPDPLVALEPDPALTAFLAEILGAAVEVRIATLEEARLEAAAYDLAIAASVFHWIDAEAGSRESMQR